MGHASRWAGREMKNNTVKSLVLVTVAALATIGCLTRRPVICVSHLESIPTVTILDENTILLSELRSTAVSDYWPAPRARIQGNEVLISASYVRWEKKGPYLIKVEHGGKKISSMDFLWLDPGGKKTRLKVQKAKPNQSVDGTR